MQMPSVSLYYNDLDRGGRSDKVYHIQVEASEKGFVVNFQYGRRGGTLQHGTKTDVPVSQKDALLTYQLLMSEKMASGYKPGQLNGCMTRYEMPEEELTKYPAELLTEIEEKDVLKLVMSDDYWMQQKADGERRQIFKKDGTDVVAYNKRGKAIPIEAALAEHARRLIGTFLLDGEIIGDKFIAYDLLERNGESLETEEYAIRFGRLRGLLRGKSAAGPISVIRTWESHEEKVAGFEWLMTNRCEGAVFKMRAATYQPGNAGQHKKFKFIKSMSCKVVAVGVKGKSNASLALQEKDGTWVEVCRASTIGKGKIAVGQIVEVLFLNATAGRQLTQPRIKEVRTDVDASECSFQKQLKPEMFKGKE